MTDQQAQNIIAFLELARTAIDNAELRIVGLDEKDYPGLALIKAMSEITAAADNLVKAVEIIREYAESVAEKPKDASTTNRATAGKPVVP